MDEPLQRRLHDLTLAARHLLVAETQELLEGVYGLHADGRFEPVDRLPALAALPEAAETRGHLEKFLADEHRAGMPADQAYRKLVKEIAFTHLNRLVAFKMMEARRLIRGTLDRYQDSNAFKFYLADHPEDLARYEAGDFPENALGESPRDVAYRHFLLWQSAQLAQDVRVLFDPDNLPSRLFPRSRALRQLIDLLNAPELRDAWLPENDETLGWVYQFFNEDEKAEVFDRLYKRKVKIQVEDIPAATELFTPRWIVRFLVHNTLSRHWVQMHPDSGLRDSWDYLVPLAGEIPPVPLKWVKEITLLDPACGTMHFGLVAFDLFVEMYREELANAGRPAWPEKSSVECEEDIPAAILAHNLFGIDIDLRAVHISALSLYLKARSFRANAHLTAINLACADVAPVNKENIDTFVRQTSFSHTGSEQRLRAFWSRLRDTSVAGSLVRVETEMRELVASERIHHEKNSRRHAVSGGSVTVIDADTDAETYWSNLETQISAALSEFGKRQAGEGINEAYFIGEASKGLGLLDMLRRRYDVVVTNPPYLDNRDYNSDMQVFMRSSYPHSRRNLYGAFLKRCLELLTSGGRLGMITPQSVMFLHGYKSLRETLNGSIAVESLIHTGLDTFPGAVVDCASYTLRREPSNDVRSTAQASYFRLVKESGFAAKRAGFERSLAALLSTGNDRAIFRYRQSDFCSIPGSPWVYWITPRLRELLASLPSLGHTAQPTVGLQTSDNTRFVRRWWEVGLLRIKFGCTNIRESEASTARWFPYMKGGGFCRWWGNQEHVVNWEADGEQVKAYICERYDYLNGNWKWIARHSDHYFLPGITYSYLTTGIFSARLSPGGFIFDVAGSSLFPEDLPLVLAVLNSTFARYLLGLMNPTINSQIGDLARLPIPTQSSPVLESLVDQAIALARADSTEDETTYDFIAPPSRVAGLADLSARKAQLASGEREIDEEVYRLYGIGPEDRAAIEAELAEPVLNADLEDTEAPEQPEEQEPTGPLTREELARRWVSYAVGIVLDRFQPGVEGALGRGSFSAELSANLRALADTDGTVTLELGHPDDLAARVEHALTLMLGEVETANLVAALGGAPHQVEATLRRYLGGDFFRWHLQLYRKRPVYWLLQSPKRSYSIYLFHERITRDTLFLVQGNRYLGGKINQTQQRLSELQSRARATEGAERRRIERESEAANTLLNELEQFAASLKTITDARNERGEVVGWAPELDDGVILNLAPLYAVIPSWSAEPRKYWERLRAGDYDWSYTAMRYWPDRVTAKCRTNKSFAIAHNLLSIYEGGA